MWLDELGRAKKQVQDMINAQPGVVAFADNYVPPMLQSSALRVSTSSELGRRQQEQSFV